jgi:glycosyltransferase involved in cell wall biosynthesis
MRIALVSTSYINVPPEKYGGAELVVYNLVEEFKRMGHHVTLFAPSGSRTSADELVPIIDQPLDVENGPEEFKVRNVRLIFSLEKITNVLFKIPFDVIHNHFGWRLLAFENLFLSPVVTTLHGPLRDPYQQMVYGHFGKSNLVSISLSQRHFAPNLNFRANIYNGIACDQYEFQAKPKNYYAFLGRISPEKGPAEAIEIAKRAGVKLIMAAKIDRSDRKYFNSKIKPYIDGKQIEFIGEIGHAKKVELLKNARALIAPIQWEEPFGMFFIEAMATGTPVITLSRGSSSEVILHGKTGYVCGDVSEMVRAINNIDRIQRSECSEHIRKHFSSEIMAGKYLELFRDLSYEFKNRKESILAAFPCKKK